MKRRRKLNSHLQGRDFARRLAWLKTRGLCFYCKTKVAYGRDSQPKMILDHFIPIRWNGLDDHSNLVAACVQCDALKGCAPPTTFTVAAIVRGVSPMWPKIRHQYPEPQSIVEMCRPKPPRIVRLPDEEKLRRRFPPLPNPVL